MQDNLSNRKKILHQVAANLLLMEGLTKEKEMEDIEILLSETRNRIMEKATLEGNISALHYRTEMPVGMPVVETIPDYSHFKL